MVSCGVVVFILIILAGMMDICKDDASLDGLLSNESVAWLEKHPEEIRLLRLLASLIIRFIGYVGIIPSHSDKVPTPDTHLRLAILPSCLRLPVQSTKITPPAPVKSEVKQKGCHGLPVVHPNLTMPGSPGLLPSGPHED